MLKVYTFLSTGLEKANFAGSLCVCDARRGVQTSSVVDAFPPRSTALRPPLQQRSDSDIYRRAFRTAPGLKLSRPSCFTSVVLYLKISEKSKPCSYIQWWKNVFRHPSNFTQSQILSWNICRKILLCFKGVAALEKIPIQVILITIISLSFTRKMNNKFWKVSRC